MVSLGARPWYASLLLDASISMLINENCKRIISVLRASSDTTQIAPTQWLWFSKGKNPTESSLQWRSAKLSTPKSWNRRKRHLHNNLLKTWFRQNSHLHLQKKLEKLHLHKKNHSRNILSRQRKFFGRVFFFFSESSRRLWLLLGGDLFCREKKRTRPPQKKKKPFGELFWPQKNIFQAGGGYKALWKPGNHIYHRNLSFVATISLPKAKKNSALEQGGVCFFFQLLGFSRAILGNFCENLFVNCEMLYHPSRAHYISNLWGVY